MKNRAKTPILALAADLSCGAAIGADTPAKNAVKEGWDRKQINEFANACSDSLLNQAVVDYNKAARADGVTLHKPFPKEAFRASAQPMCLCVSLRAAETWSLKEMEKGGLARTRPMIDEALSGGRCKPDGLLGEIARKQKASQ